ncbi:dUTP diphosphatase [Robertmurraya sp. FSL W8-0741]|uniref:dUTP diphosphatase n=1 Tax=Robertmurraya sp. FSL W8-0741 TaxID=2954629 RepID=UPI0030FD16AD
MNLIKLFETQRKFRERVNYQGSDRLEKLILALMVELGECANEWRGFKFWSKNQEPRTKVQDPHAYPIVHKNPLLEEYVDGLHFILELGLEYELNDFKYAVFICDSVEKQFIYLYRATTDLFAQDRLDRSLHNYRNLIQLYFGLGEMLGFTWDEVEQAYYAKNAVNHQRQEEGY